MFNPRLAIHRAYEAMLPPALRHLGPGHDDPPSALTSRRPSPTRRPIVAHKPRGASAKSIKALADELLNRVSYTVQGEPSDDSRRVA